MNETTLSGTYVSVLWAMYLKDVCHQIESKREKKPGVKYYSQTQGWQNSGNKRRLPFLECIPHAKLGAYVHY